MKTVKIFVNNSTGYQGCYTSEEFEVEVEDDATDEEIEKIAQEYYSNWMSNFDTGVCWEQLV